MIKGYVYLLLTPDNEGNEFFKIGISKNNPELRIKQLSTGNPNKITSLKIYESQNYKKIERWFHKKYSDLKTPAHNEWFNLTDEHVFSFIDDCKEIDDNLTFLNQQNDLI